MAKKPTRKLKVFAAQIGFYDFIVAAPNQTAALRALGTRQNLFASGQARLIDDEQAVSAALEHPEVPLRRVIGTDNPYELKPRGLPNIPDAPKKWAVSVNDKRPDLPTKPSEPPVDRSRLETAETALKKVDDERKREEADFRDRQAALDAEKAQQQVNYIERRKAATASLVAERQAYRRAGGSD